MDGEARVYTPDEMMMLGMKCLADNFGLVNAEQFINSVRAACPDYTAWRRQMFDDMYVDDVFRMADEDTDKRRAMAACDYGKRHLCCRTEVNQMRICNRRLECPIDKICA